MTLSELIAAAAPPLPSLMPMVHATQAQHAIEILKQGKLDPRQCKVFSEDLSYFFYAKNAYKVDGHVGTTAPALAPVVFIFNTPATFHMCHAFDTGAANRKMYDSFFAMKTPMQQIEVGKIGTTEQSLRSAISALYGSNRAYITEETDQLAKISVPPTSFDLQQLVALLKDDAWTASFDDRRRTFEIQLSSSIVVDESTLRALVYPRTFDDDATFDATLAAMPTVERITYPAHHMSNAQRAHGTATNQVEALMLKLA